MYKHILIATDGSELASNAVRHGAALAKAVGAAVTLLTVTEPWQTAFAAEAAIIIPHNDYSAAMTAQADGILSKAKTIATGAGVTCETHHAADQYPADGIIAAAKHKGCDLIVVATHGRRGFARLLLGSQTQQVVTRAAIPVLVIR